MWLLLRHVSTLGGNKAAVGVHVQIALDVGRVDLGGQGEGVHEELAEGARRLGLLVQDVVDVVGDAVEHLQDLLDGALQRLNVGEDGLLAALGVLGSGDELQTALLGLTVLDLVGHGDEQAAVGGALGGDANGGGDVGAGLDVLAGDGGHGQVDGRVRPGAVALLAVEVLDQGGEGVELGRRGVPADQDLARVGAQVQLQHLLLVVHVDLDLLLGLGVGDGVAVADLDLGAILAADTEQGADDALLVGVAAQRVVKDGEESLGWGQRAARGREREADAPEAGSRR